MSWPATHIYRLTSQLHKAANGLCFWCGFRAFLTNARAENFAANEWGGRAPHAGDLYRARTMTMATFDHRKPKAHGGHDTLANGLLSCRWCNQWRGTEDPLLYGVRINALVAADQHPRQIYATVGKWPAKFPDKLDMEVFSNGD